jgi:hypothetical protein
LNYGAARSTIASLRTAPHLLALCALLSCDRTPEPTPEPLSAPAAAAAAPSATAAPADSGGGVSWTDPPRWKRETPSSPMRKATYRIPKAKGDPEDSELGVFQFGSRGGGVQANVDRWVKQFEGVQPSDVKRSEKSVAGMRVHLVEIPSGTYQSGMPGGPTTPKPDFAMYAAIVEAPGGAWFFKLTGPKKTVAEAKPELDALIASVKKS